jgi:hypothetical protein
VTLLDIILIRKHLDLMRTRNIVSVALVFIVR